MSNRAKCIRCGGCCQAVPCWWAQIHYGCTASNKQPCPMLEQHSDGTTTCHRMMADSYMRHEMLGTGCYNPQYRKKIKAVTL